MENINKSLEFWLNQLKNHEQTSYEALPDIELYVNQVITYLERQLNVFALSSLEKQITPAMINNYVKGDVLDSPILKKYSNIHLAKILEIYSLKKVLSIDEIKQVLDIQFSNGNNLESYNTFSHKYKEVLDTTSIDTLKKLKNIDDNDYQQLNDLALKLALQASVNTLISTRILDFIRIKKELD